jgi:hypothetical protein
MNMTAGKAGKTVLVVDNKLENLRAYRGEFKPIYYGAFLGGAL